MEEVAISAAKVDKDFFMESKGPISRAQWSSDHTVIRQARQQSVVKFETRISRWYTICHFQLMGIAREKKPSQAAQRCLNRKKPDLSKIGAFA